MRKFNVNGTDHVVAVEDDKPLLWVLREDLRLTGTKYGCGIAQCGACTVQIDGIATRSCVLPISAVEETQSIVTIEGLSADGSHPVQRAWAELEVPQCGYCQSGMIMAASGLLAQNSQPSDDHIAEGITNLCRCGTYNRVRDAIKLAARNVSRGSEG
jgi:isoquinoline 1-oxidoreductase alpha subunit